MGNKRLISIDSSTKKSAYAIFDNGTYIQSELINLEKIRNMDERFMQMSLQLINILIKYQPEVVYIEDTVVPRNVQTQRFLTRLQGVVYAYCVMNGCEFYTIRPTVWRKLVGIKQGKKKRDELKEAAINLVMDKFGMQVNDDEAEAVLIGIAAIKQRKEQGKGKKYENKD